MNINYAYPQIGLNIDSLMLVISMLVADCFGG
jgi:hypothetical protein